MDTKTSMAVPPASGDAVEVVRLILWLRAVGIIETDGVNSATLFYWLERCQPADRKRALVYLLTNQMLITRYDEIVWNGQSINRGMKIELPEQVIKGAELFCPRSNPNTTAAADKLLDKHILTAYRDHTSSVPQLEDVTRAAEVLDRSFFTSSGGFGTEEAWNARAFAFHWIIADKFLPLFWGWDHTQGCLPPDDKEYALLQELVPECRYGFPAFLADPRVTQLSQGAARALFILDLVRYTVAGVTDPERETQLSTLDREFVERLRRRIQTYLSEGGAHLDKLGATCFMMLSTRLAKA